MSRATNYHSDQLTSKNRSGLEMAVMPDLARWAESFMSAKRAEGVSRKTVTAYTECLKKFLKWCDNRGLATVETLTTTHVREFMLFLEEQGHNSGGQHLHYRVLKTFLRWYEFEVEPDGWRNPIHKVKAPKLVTEPIDPVPLEDIEVMLTTCKGNRQGLRDKALLLTRLDTGVRAMVGKGRTVFLGERGRRAMRAYLKARGPAPGPLFERETGGRLKYPGPRQIVRRCAEVAGIEEPPLHSFRRAFTITMLRNGADIHAIHTMQQPTSRRVCS